MGSHAIPCLSGRYVFTYVSFHKEEYLPCNLKRHVHQCVHFCINVSIWSCTCMRLRASCHTLIKCHIHVRPEGKKCTEKPNESFIHFWDVRWKCVYDEISKQISYSLSQLSYATLLTRAQQIVLWGYWNIKIKQISLKQRWTITQDTDKKKAVAIKTLSGWWTLLWSAHNADSCSHGDLLWSPTPTFHANVPLKPHFL